LTLGEIEKGILLLDEGKRRREIKQWFENDLQARFAGRILAIDKEVASSWARFIAPLLKARTASAYHRFIACGDRSRAWLYVCHAQCEALRRAASAVSQSLGRGVKRHRASNSMSAAWDPMRLTRREPTATGADRKFLRETKIDGPL
jgi:hypothetical protein